MTKSARSYNSQRGWNAQLSKDVRRAVADLLVKSQNHRIAVPTDRRWALALFGLFLLVCSHPLVWQGLHARTLFAPLGVGLALTAWLGYKIVPGIAAILCIVQICYLPDGTTRWQATGAAALSAVEIGSAWWCYRRAGGTRRLDDPRSTTLFLLLVPCLFGGIFATLQVLNGYFVSPDSASFGQSVLELWIGDILGIVAVAPPLLAVATPWLVHYRLAFAEASEPRFPSAFDVESRRRGGNARTGDRRGGAQRGAGRTARQRAANPLALVEHAVAGDCVVKPAFGFARRQSGCMSCNAVGTGDGRAAHR
jgi:MASE1